MKITGVGINRPLNKTQGSIKKIVSVAKPLNMGIGQVSGQPTNDVDDNLDALDENYKKSLITLGKEVDVLA